MGYRAGSWPGGPHDPTSPGARRHPHAGGGLRHHPREPRLGARGHQLPGAALRRLHPRPGGWPRLGGALPPRRHGDRPRGRHAVPGRQAPGPGPRGPDEAPEREGLAAPHPLADPRRGPSAGHRPHLRPHGGAATETQHQPLRDVRSPGPPGGEPGLRRAQGAGGEALRPDAPLDGRPPPHAPPGPARRQGHHLAPGPGARQAPRLQGEKPHPGAAPPHLRREDGPGRPVRPEARIRPSAASVSAAPPTSPCARPAGASRRARPSTRSAAPSRAWPAPASASRPPARARR